MGDLKPIGSEKLQGQDKLRRIMEIARFNETIPSNINETARTEFNRTLSDGNNYEIVKERQGYIIKKTISESQTEYIEPMKNRKYYSSYSQALKRLNLVAGELNRVNENEEGTSMFGEQKKFTLKTPKPKAQEIPMDSAPMAPPMAPPPVPEPELPAAPEGEMGMGDEELDLELEPEGDMGADMETDVETNGGDDEQVTFKSIQKLTGKLTQKIRTLDNQEGMTSEDIKYVINMVLSSLDLKSLSEEDKEDIVSKFEEDSEDLGGDDMDGEDLTDDSEVEDIQSDMDIPMEGEMGEEDDDDYVDDPNYSEENYKKLLKKLRKTTNSNNNTSSLFRDRSKFTKMMGSFDDEHGFYDQDDRKYAGDFDFDYDEEEFDDFDSFDSKYGGKQGMFDRGEKGKVFFDKYKEKFGKPFKVRTPRNVDYGNGAIIDSIFGESAVDKVISKYFEVSKKEIVENRERNTKKKLQTISEVRKQMNEVIKLTETIEQELAAQKFLKNNANAKIVGITNKKNLVFENKGREIKITPEGRIL